MKIKPHEPKVMPPDYPKLKDTQYTNKTPPENSHIYEAGAGKIASYMTETVIVNLLISSSFYVD